MISKDTFGQKNAEYWESIYVGYRYYDKAKKAVRSPFGHGLSYTTFTYSDLEIKDDAAAVTVTNTGTYPGAEVVQLYIAPPKGGLHRPELELKGFSRVESAPGKSRRVSFPLDSRSFAVWDNGWKIPGGVYELRVGASSRDIRLHISWAGPGIGGNGQRAFYPGRAGDAEKVKAWRMPNEILSGHRHRCVLRQVHRGLAGG